MHYFFCFDSFIHLYGRVNIENEHKMAKPYLLGSWPRFLLVKKFIVIYKLSLIHSFDVICQELFNWQDFDTGCHFYISNIHTCSMNCVNLKANRLGRLSVFGTVD